MMRIARCLLAGYAVVLLSGCMVAESKYLKKVEDADRLSKSLTDLTVKHEKLAAENTALQNELGKSKEDNEQLTREKKELEQLMKSRPDALSQGVGELRQKFSDLEAENRMLRSDSESRQRFREKRVKDAGTAYESLLQELKNEISLGLFTVTEMRGRLAITISSDVIFQPGKAVITPRGTAIITKTAEALKKLSDKLIQVNGHTDSTPVPLAAQETYPTNWELSAAMAVSVTRQLQQLGINAGILSATAFAESKPIADNGSEEGRTRNRRLEIIVTAREL